MDLASVVSVVWGFLTTTVGVVTSLGVVGVVIAAVSRRLTGDGLDRFARRLYRRPRVPDALAEALMDGGPVDVTDHGFTWLRPERFTDDSKIDREACWRRRFHFAEIHRGFAADRVPPDQESGSLTTELVETLRGGNARVVLGAPGAGKSTLIRQVAERWRMGEHGDAVGVGSDRVGRVLYRDRGSGARITDTDELAEAIRRIPEPVLVIVSDATRQPHLPVFTLLEEFADDDEVSFLFDSRETEWEDGLTGTAQRLADADTDADVVAPDSDRWDEIVTEKNDLDAVPLDELTETETERVIDSFERVTGQSVRMDAGRIHDRITDDSQASAMLLLSYFLPVGPVEVDRSDPEFSLEGHVGEVYDDVTPDSPETELSASDRLRRQTAIGVNVLNAAGFAVREESLLELADNKTERDEIRRLLEDELTGVVFGRDGEAFETNHELWSELFLVRLADSRRQSPFEKCLNGLSAGPYEESRGQFLWEIFQVGVRQAKLAPLFGTTEESRIEVPDSRSQQGLANQRGQMNHGAGNWDVATDEYESVLVATEDPGMRATVLNNLGLIARSRGEYGEAKESHEESLGLFEDLGDTAGRASSLTNLGTVAGKTNNWGDAREKFERAATIYDEIGNFRGFLKSDRGAIIAHHELGNDTEALQRARDSLERIENSDLDGLDDHRQFREDVIDEITD